MRRTLASRLRQSSSGRALKSCSRAPSDTADVARISSSARRHSSQPAFTLPNRIAAKANSPSQSDGEGGGSRTDGLEDFAVVDVDGGLGLLLERLLAPGGVHAVPRTRCACSITHPL